MRLTQFAQPTHKRSEVCPRCGYLKFWTKRFGWRCGPSCHGNQENRQEWHACAKLSEGIDRPDSGTPLTPTTLHTP